MTYSKNKEFMNLKTKFRFLFSQTKQILYHQASFSRRNRGQLAWLTL